MIHDYIYLASASPRRRALLDQIGVPYRVRSEAVDESGRPDEAPARLVQRLAVAKAQAVGGHLDRREVRPILAADTAVVIDDVVLGKPRDRADGLRMLRRLSGATHQVLTAVALVHRDRAKVRLTTSRVRFRPLEPGEDEAYWATGEPRDKAGSYAIQGLAAIFVERLEGSYSGVMGLPLFEAAALLREVGFDLWSAARGPGR